MNTLTGKGRQRFNRYTGLQRRQPHAPSKRQSHHPRWREGIKPWSIREMTRGRPEAHICIHFKFWKKIHKLFPTRVIRQTVEKIYLRGEMSSDSSIAKTFEFKYKC